MNYFGTNLNDKGHYHWSINDNSWQRIVPPDLPFDPYFIANEARSTYHFFTLYGYTGLAIAGSPSDMRLGCVSVFYMRGIDLDDFKVALEQNAIAAQIINKLGCALIIDQQITNK